MPGDVSIVSIGDTDLSRLFSPAITSLDWDLEAVGKSVAQLLLRRLDKTVRSEPERILITTRLVLRESGAPAKPGVRHGARMRPPSKDRP